MIGSISAKLQADTNKDPGLPQLRTAASLKIGASTASHIVRARQYISIPKPDLMVRQQRGGVDSLVAKLQVGPVLGKMYVNSKSGCVAAARQGLRLRPQAVGYMVIASKHAT
jgi:porphobilinogen deaminase